MFLLSHCGVHEGKYLDQSCDIWRKPSDTFDETQKICLQGEAVTTGHKK